MRGTEKRSVQLTFDAICTSCVHKIALLASNLCLEASNAILYLSSWYLSIKNIYWSYTGLVLHKHNLFSNPPTRTFNFILYKKLFTP